MRLSFVLAGLSTIALEAYGVEYTPLDASSSASSRARIKLAQGTRRSDQFKPRKGGRTWTFRLKALVTADELDDKDEADAIATDLEQTFAHWHHVQPRVELVRTRAHERQGRNIGDVVVTFEDEDTALAVFQAYDGKVFGGKTVVGTWEDTHKARERHDVAVPLLPPTEQSVQVSTLVSALLKRLAALQTRAHVHNPRQDKRSRRFVLGMQEVRRGLCGRNKLVFLVVATDVAAEGAVGAVGATYSELLALATARNVPIVAPFNRRKLGKVVQKSVRVSCVGIYSIDGANDLFQQLGPLLPRDTTRSRMRLHASSCVRAMASFAAVIYAWKSASCRMRVVGGNMGTCHILSVGRWSSRACNTWIAVGIKGLVARSPRATRYRSELAGRLVYPRKNKKHGQNRSARNHAHVTTYNWFHQCHAPETSVHEPAELERRPGRELERFTDKVAVRAQDVKHREHFGEHESHHGPFLPRRKQGTTQTHKNA
ncbi:hypothetical protein PsorP6_000823 [Peronosclerospora sorghi]|uniref:Uncharacterized protein n=1 Tax=Peronosclerospora sorghi TaxID=230839 RepID=A0ACC0WQ73_9STRA|nr:hypothetical protein PsorP6_000823 [Peronosclerospora sorghi]